MAPPTGYSLCDYGGMVTCEPRMAAFNEALGKRVGPGSTVIDLGAGFGIFSLIACKLGAGNVVAIETDNSIELLRAAARDNGCSDRITVLQGLSTDYVPSQRADVIVSDLRGSLPLFERHIPAIVDARERLLAPGGHLIPMRDTLRIALAESPKSYKSCQEPWDSNDYGIDLSFGKPFAVNSWWKVSLSPENLLCEPTDLAVLDYYSIEEPDLRADVTLEARRRGTAHGLLVWFDTELAPGTGYSNAPGEPELVYGQSFFPLEEPLDLAPGDQVSIEFSAKLVGGEYVISWNTSTGPNGGEKARRFRQSSFRGKVFSPRSLKARAGHSVPECREAHLLDRHCLSLIDGKRTLDEIATLMADEFPGKFSHKSDALNFVTALSQRYG